jgi:hypothetical protein
MYNVNPYGPFVERENCKKKKKKKTLCLPTEGLSVTSLGEAGIPFPEALSSPSGGGQDLARPQLQEGHAAGNYCQIWRSAREREEVERLHNGRSSPVLEAATPSPPPPVADRARHTPPPLSQIEAIKRAGSSVATRGRWGTTRGRKLCARLGKTTLTVVGEDGGAVLGIRRSPPAHQLRRRARCSTASSMPDGRRRGLGSSATVRLLFGWSSRLVAAVVLPPVTSCWWRRSRGRAVSSAEGARPTISVAAWDMGGEWVVERVRQGGKVGNVGPTCRSL